MEGVGYSGVVCFSWLSALERRARQKGSRDEKRGVFRGHWGCCGWWRRGGAAPKGLRFGLGSLPVLLRPCCAPTGIPHHNCR